VPTKFVRKEFYPQGWEPSVAQFLELFHRYGYIYRPFNADHWLSAKEEYWKLSDSEILKAVACAHDKFIGTRAGKTTRYAVLDIDTKSKYHNQAQLDRLLHVLSQAGLRRSSLYRSSFSGGWHLYIFFDEEISTADLRRQLVHLLTLNDFVVADGVLEVFPNPGNGSMGKGLRLPLQPGFAWLDKRNLEVDHYREEMTATKALEFFLDCLESDANSFKDFRQLKTHVQELEARKRAAVNHGVATPADNVVPFRRPQKPVPPSEYSSVVSSVFGHIPPGMNADTWYKGQQFHIQGLSGPSQRAEAIFSLGQYFFYGDPSRDLPALGYGYEEERKWAIRQFLDARHNGQSKDINCGRADALAQVDRAANWLPAHKKGEEPIKYSPTRPISWIRENANRMSGARKRIQDALDGLKKFNRSFTTVELQETAACSRRTLYDHADIWRQDYEDLAAGLFAICTDEYNVVVGAACPESKPPSTVAEKITPPGLLAARRVAYEISMRTKRDIRNREKAALASSEVSENQWRDKVTSLTSEKPSELPVQNLKSLIVVLANYLSLAPYEEDAVPLAAFITELRRELKARSQGPAPPLFSG
jgi:hypothetical protein